MPLVIQTSFSVAGLTSLDHHWRAIVFASKRELFATPMRVPFRAAICGAQKAETLSSGSSTRLMRPDSAWPKMPVIKSSSRSAVCA